MQNKQVEEALREVNDSPVAWFIELEVARQSRDFERAAQATRQLRRLGVVVKYRRPLQGGLDHA